jgi:uncharacterized membrane protein
MQTGSNIILKCSCGKTITVPEGAGGAAGARGKCPKCGGEIAVPPAGKGPAAIGSSCPVCQTDIQEGDVWSRCGACNLVHHQECWAEVGGCGAYGCANAPAKAAEAAAAATAAPTSAWGDTKKCPVCGEKIKAIAVKCRYCQTELGTVDPMTSDEFRTTHIRKYQNTDFKRGVIIIFAFSLIGVFAPIMLIVSLIVVFVNRAKMKEAGQLSQALGYTSIAISGLYTLLIVIFLIGSLS